MGFGSKAVVGHSRLRRRLWLLARNTPRPNRWTNLLAVPGNRAASYSCFHHQQSDRGAKAFGGRSPGFKSQRWSWTTASTSDSMPLVAQATGFTNAKGDFF